MSPIDSFAVVGALALLAGSVMQTVEYGLSQSRLLKDQAAWDALVKAELRRLPRWTWRRKARAKRIIKRQLLENGVVSTLEFAELRRLFRTTIAWGFIVVGALYAVVASIANVV